MSFKIHRYFPDDLLPTLTIDLIGYFSVDGDSEYHADLSQLKYYIPPPNLNNINYDLNTNLSSVHYKNPESFEKLDFVLRWITENFNRLEKPLSAQRESWLDVDFICRRGVLKLLLCCPYKRKENDTWIICATKYRGTIYLCHFYTDEKHIQDAYASPNNQYKNMTWGFKFEQFMVAANPSDKPDPSAHLNICEDFYCVLKAKFGDHSLLYSAETDCIFSQEPIKDTLIGKTFELIELKTSPIYTDKGTSNEKFLPNKAIHWWSQNYLIGTNKIICGLRDRFGIVRMIKEYSADLLPEKSKPPCDVRNCKKFCNIFLDNVKKIVTKDYNECIYKFYWNPGIRDVSYSEEAPNHEIYFFLKPWFVEKAEKYKNTYT